jgi:hypothetical protein
MFINMLVSLCVSCQQQSSGSYKTVNIITQEDFEKMTPRAPRKLNPEVPPPPPPSLSQSLTVEEPVAEIAKISAVMEVSTSWRKQTLP